MVEEEEGQTVDVEGRLLAEGSVGKDDLQELGRGTAGRRGDARGVTAATRR